MAQYPVRRCISHITHCARAGRTRCRRLGLLRLTFQPYIASFPVLTRFPFLDRALSRVRVRVRVRIRNWRMCAHVTRQRLEDWLSVSDFEQN